MTIKEAVEWMKAFKQAKFKCIAPKQVSEAMELLNSQNRCLNCGKKLKPYLKAKNYNTGKWDGHSFTCNCFPKGVVMSIG